MASFRRNKAGKWEVQIARKGIRRSGTFGSKAEATKWAHSIEGEILGGKRGAIDKTFGDLLKKYQAEVTPTKGSARIEEQRIGRILTDDIANVGLRELTSTEISRWRDERAKVVAPATVIRDMSVMSAALTVAVKEWKWLDHNPIRDVKWPKAPEGRERRISQDEIDRILFSAGYDYEAKPESIGARMGAAFLFAIETGMRAGEIAGLTMDRVFLEKKYVHLRAIDCKGRVKRDVSLSPEAIRIITQMAVTDGNVFGLTSLQISATFQRAKGYCGIKDMTFHDTRHEAVTRLSKKLGVLQLAEMIGHKNVNQLRTYFNESATDIAEKL